MFIWYLSFLNDSLDGNFVFPDFVFEDCVLLQESNLFAQRSGLVLLRRLREILHLALHPEVDKKQ